MPTAKAYAAFSADSALAPFVLQRRDPLPQDIRIGILYCGVCHSDLHQARNEWNATTYPCVPGHEIVGKVLEVGRSVTKFKPGDTVAVGCMVDSCRTCPNCVDALEQHCEHGPVFTYNSPDPHGGGMTFGGYAESIVVDEAFVLLIPDGLDLAAAAPLLCAGITTYSPLRHWKVGAGQRVGVVGLGGLGHMALKFAHTFGAETVLFTTTPDKAEDARRLGADEVVVSRDPEAMARQAGRFDFILDTVSAPHDIDAYLNLLRRDGTLTLVGVPPQGVQVMPFSLIGGRRRLAGSLIGGIRETQEMLDFCGEHGIVCDIELIPIQGINDAFERMLKGDVKYRFVIDMATLSGESSGGR